MSFVSTMLPSPLRVLVTVLALVFVVELGIMLALPWVMPGLSGETAEAFVDAILLTLVCAPVLWWVIIGPLRRIAIQEHQRSETIVSNASEGIITFNHEGVILSCNRAAAEILSKQVEDVVGKDTNAFLFDLPKQFSALPISLRLNSQRLDGTSFPVEVSVSEYPSESRPLYIAIFRDLTAAVEAEAQRVSMARETEALRAQQMATLAQLATGVAHEIRNPLTSIKMLVQVNRDKLAAAGFLTDDLQLVEHEIRRMERSVNSLLEYARPEVGIRVLFPVQRSVQKTVQLISGRCSQQSVRLELDIAERPVLVVGDPAQIQQLLLNLALNALDAMPTGGQLTIRVGVDSRRALVAVNDTGTGIPEDMLHRLFEPFFTSKPGGVGLGLGICRSIATAHDGTLTAANRAGGGAEFLLSLPLVEDEIADENQQKEAD